MTSTIQYQKNPNDPINNDFREDVLRDIGNIETTDNDIKHIQYAFDVYCSLNAKIRYDPETLNLNIMDKEVLNKVINKPKSEINKNNNKVNCGIWSRMYADFLTDQGWNVYIVKGARHEYIEAYYGKYKIIADATQRPVGCKEPLNDITKAQLGVKPFGFRVINIETNIEEKIDSLINLNNTINKSLSENYYPHANKSDVSQLISLIEEISPEKHVENKYMKFDEIIEKFIFINDILKENKLDNMECIQYLMHIFNIIFKGESLNKIIQMSCNMLAKRRLRFQTYTSNIIIYWRNKYYF